MPPISANLIFISLIVARVVLTVGRCKEAALDLLRLLPYTRLERLREPLRFLEPLPGFPWPEAWLPAWEPRRLPDA